jgi:hypothetical protein
MMRVAAICLTLALLISRASAQATNDIRSVCLPILLNTVVPTIENYSSSQFFRHFVTLIYSKRNLSLEQVEKQGFELGVVVEGVPLKALWSNDSNQKKKAEEVYSRFVDDTVLKNDITQSKEVKGNGFALAEYNHCVATMATTQSPLACYFSVETERDHATLHVLFRPSFKISSAKIKESGITNGFILANEHELEHLKEKSRINLEQALEKLSRGEPISRVPPGGSSSLVRSGSTLDTGVYSFPIYRLNPDRQMSVTLLYQNGLSCNVASEPVAKSQIVASIWPSGRDWKAGQDKFFYDVTFGCGGSSRQARTFCSGSSAKITSIESPQTWSANCGSTFESVVKKGDNCVLATGTLRGCGFTQPWKTCKGRGWLKTNITVNRDAPGQAYDPERSSKTDSSLAASWTKLFDYEGSLPAAFRPDGWHFNIQIVRETTTGIESLVLTEAAPRQGDCAATVPSASDRSGRVVVSCGPQATTVPAGLLVAQ